MAGDTLVEVTQAGNGGAVSSTLYLDNYYLEGIPAANMITAVFQISTGVLCSTSVTATAGASCPKGLDGTKCAILSCQAAAPVTSTSEPVVASITICPPSNLNCGAMSAISSAQVSLTAASPNPQQPPPPPATAPTSLQPDQPLPTAGTPDQTAVVDVPGSTNSVGSHVEATTGSSAPSHGSPSTPNNGNPSVQPSSFSPASSSPVAAIGGGIGGALIFVICAVAFFIQRRRSQAKRGREVALERMTSPDLPFGRPVKFEQQERIARKPAEVQLPQLSTTKEGKYDPTIAPPKFKSLDRASLGVPQSRRSNSLGRPSQTNSLGRPVQSNSLGRPAPAASGSNSSSNTLERGRRRSSGASTLERTPRQRSKSKDAPFVDATSPLQQVSQRTIATTAASAVSTAVVIHPGYYDEQGQYHYFTPEQLQQLQQQQNRP
ncbi:UNVERIFIED_CONTAM: hypothetical protein HDU68_010383 [Siphonaria sp. JEL0065]|nr:hypothetical protein HDU68_010383 [Siphonaria sp. JEL0065]